MTISAFRIKNFMAFADSGWISIRPITLLFGQNSSGKSSILKALMLLKQSVDTSKFTFVSEYGVDLGGYANITHGTNKSVYIKSKKRVSVGFKVPISADLLLNSGVASQIATLNIDFGWNPEKETPDVVAFEVILTPDNIVDDELYFKVEVENYTGDEVNSNLVFDTNMIGDEAIIKKTNIWRETRLKTIHGFMPVLDIQISADTNERPRDWEFINGILARLRDEIFKFFKAISHIKPIRPDPERLFVIHDMKQEELKRQGFTSFLKFLNQGYTNIQQKNILNTWIRQLALGQEIHVKRYSDIPGTSIISEISITNLAGQKLNLADVGFGVSQVLPVLIECLFSESGSTILIQQPELHLHPAAQAELGEVFISSVTNMNKTYILETHSEHLILRLQREVRNKRFSHNSISVNYIDNDKNKSNCIYIRMNDNGDFIDEWPNGFFEEGYKEIFGA